MNGAFHRDQTDFAAFCVLELKAMEAKFAKNLIDKTKMYYLSNQLLLNFLGKIGLNKTFSLDEVKNRIKPSEGSIINYDI